MPMTRDKGPFSPRDVDDQLGLPVALTSGVYAPTMLSKYSEVHPQEPLKNTIVGGIVVGTMVGATLLLAGIFFLYKYWRAVREHRNFLARGVLPGPRLPVTPDPANDDDGIRRFDGNTGNDVYGITHGTLEAGHRATRDSTSYHGYMSNAARGIRRLRSADNDDLRINRPQQDIELQPLSRPSYSRSAHGVDSPEAESKGHPSHDEAGSESSSLPSSSSASDNHKRASTGSPNWPLVNTASSPALIGRAPQNAPATTLTSPFGDVDAIKEMPKERIEREQNRRDAYRKLGGELPAQYQKKPGSVARARQNLPAAIEATKKPGSVAHARQEMLAAQGLRAQPADDAEVQVVPRPI